MRTTGGGGVSAPHGGRERGRADFAAIIGQRLPAPDILKATALGLLALAGVTELPGADPDAAIRRPRGGLHGAPLLGVLRPPMPTTGRAGNVELEERLAAF